VEEKPKEAKPVAVTLIDPKRANNCGASNSCILFYFYFYFIFILLSSIYFIENNLISDNTAIMLSSRFKMPFEKIREAVVNLDPTILTADAVDNLILYAPTTEELDIIESFEDDKAKLGAAERFFWVMKVCLLLTSNTTHKLMPSANPLCRLYPGCNPD
jgi:hypothetical protein